MVTFDINGAIVEFDEKTDNYNSIRKSFKNQAEYARDNFKNYCLNNILTLKDLSEKSLEIGMYNIESTIKKGVETLVGYNLITIDINTFKECYCEKYLNYQRMFNNTIKQTKTKSKKNNYMTKSSLKPLIENLSQYIYNDCFNIHNAVIDALIKNDIEIVSSKIDEENIKKSSALFNNYKDGFINRVDGTMVVKQIITLNPYRMDVYEYLVKEDGDFNREIERLADYLGYDLKPYKNQLMDEYIDDCLKNDTDIEFIKEKVVKYAKYIGSLNEAIYLTRIDAIQMFENS